MILTCYFCDTDLPSNKIKRCSRCLLVTYCSKECQTLSWKAGHKLNCKVHASIVSPMDPAELELDKSLSRWIQLWRSCFQTWTPMALDLANHPADRIMTHCIQIVIQPCELENNPDPAKQFKVIEASVVTTDHVRGLHPDLEVHLDPTDFTRLRFVVILLNHDREANRVRLIQWNDLNIGKWRAMDKATCAVLESGWAGALMYAVGSMGPKEVQELLNRKRSSG